jgi:hypothetical protein
MIFIGMQERSSGQIRGIQISDHIRSMGLDCRFIDSRDSSASTARDQTVIFIRSIDRSLASRLKSQGCKVVFDTLDRPVADIHESQRSHRDFSWSTYDIPEVDHFIVNNTLVKNHVMSATGKQCTIIPHHAVGSDHRVRSSIKTAGYIGLPDQLENQSEIEALLSKFGIRFQSKNPLKREECIRDISSLDLGIIFLRDSERANPVLKYKPNTKLTNFQSFGIPTISIPYHSFVEFGGDAWIKSSETGFMHDLESLLSSHSLRDQIESLSISSIENSKNYSLDKICKIYLEIDEK